MFRVIKSEEIISFRLRIIAPRLAGINKLKEKLKAFWGDKPNNKAEKIVPPDRDMAGNIASAWKTPIIKAEKKFNGLSFVAINLVDKTIIPLNRKKYGNK